MSTAHGQTARLAILFAVAFIAVNVAFFIGSGTYFNTHQQVIGGVSAPYSPDDALHIRSMFALSAAIIAVVSVIVGLARRMLGHLLVAGLGVIDLIGGVAALGHDLPPVLIATLFLAGVLLPVLAWFSYHGSRAAWSFLAAMCGVFAVVGLFGAPRLRDVLDVSLWTMMLLPGLYLVATLTLYLLRHDYVDRGAVRT